ALHLSRRRLNSDGQAVELRFREDSLTKPDIARTPDSIQGTSQSVRRRSRACPIWDDWPKGRHKACPYPQQPAANLLDVLQ
ncbi:MAG: hypothetical protein ACOYXY_15570, partial [Thermodesulfobacteriota bacterium]